MKAIALPLALAASLLPVRAPAQVAAKGTSTMPVAKVVGMAITFPWLRATPKGAPVAGGYVTIKNVGGKPDRLIGASLSMAPKGEVHTMTMVNGVMHMRRLDNGLAIAPGQTIVLQPGGDHLMFGNPAVPLKEGESVEGTLAFAVMGTVPVTFTVAGMAAKGPPGSKASVGHAAMPGMDMH